ncbi:hypothetical protein HWV62_14318 [Athelia sp. TMB]|nr:hypothetical protein HWV62_14318 [Athelia sp. TMB]
MVQGIEPEKDRPWFLAFFPELLSTVRDLPIHGDVFAKMINFMCGGLQHERFKGARPMILTTAVKLISTSLRRTENFAEEIKVVRSVLAIHANVFVSVAFAPSHSGGEWAKPRDAAQDLIKTILFKDVEDVASAIVQLCRLLASRSDAILPHCKIDGDLWAKTYASIQMSDFESISTVISVAAQAAHIDVLTKNSFLPSLKTRKDPKIAASGESIIDDINASLNTISDGFLTLLSSCADSPSTQLLDLIRRPSVVKHIVILMLSPVERLQTGAQMLVGQAFDVDGRLDCFRAILENLPDASLDGLFQFMETFIKYAPHVPEACSLSKSLVRCLTDIIEVLCSGINGLLHIARWTRIEDKAGPASRLPELWHLMSKCITIVFKRTPSWSLYFEPEEMTAWMRDALIFGRDMLAQRRVIESVASSAPHIISSKRAKSIAEAMVDDLQGTLPELARWLRLTDEELLHQSFALLQSLLDCLRETHVLPSPEGTARLTKHIDDARKKDPNRPQTRLDSARLSQLEDALAAFDEEDEVQIISHTTRPIKKPEADSRSAKARETAQPRQSHTSTKATPAASLSKVDFTKEDQKKLNTLDPVPTFRRQDKVTLPSVPRGPSSRSSSVTGSKSDGANSNEPADSSDDSESEEEESQSGLAALVKFQKSPKVKKPTERRQVKLLDIPSKGNRVLNDRLAQRQDARRTALRLKPDISGLHRALLSWSYDHVGPLPPSFSKTSHLRPIPDQFADHNHYLSIFEPLLLLECWSQIVQSKDEKQDACDCKITGRGFIDNWLDLDATLSEPLPKDWRLAETDIILLRPLGGKSSILGKVQSYRTSSQGVYAAFRVLISPTQTDPGLQINTHWRLSKVFSTLHREYAALMAAPYFDSFDNILQPRLTPIPSINRQDISRTMARYKLNEPQAVAILGSMQVDGFALIQGPPGTGKTSTICGLVQTFLESRLKPATILNMGRNGVSADREPVKKILLCAPSNAAIDEVSHRLKEIRPASGGSPLNVVRIGTEKSINIAVKDISLDNLVDQKLNADQSARGTAPKDTDNEVTLVRSELEAVRKMKEQKVAELASVQNNAARMIAIEADIKRLTSRRLTLGQQFDRLKDKRKNEFRSLDATRRKYRAEVLNEADVICATLSGAGHESLEQYDFEMVIIDEAAQAIELSSLIPLKFSCKRCVMVGDPQQLPPTVLSQEASKYKYNQSLFVRLQKRQPDAVHLLSIQYRMHPEISQLPSRLFYQGRLLDGPDMATKTIQPWQSHEKFGTYQFFNVARGQEHQASSHSIKNDLECQVAVALYNRLRQEYSDIDFDYRVGIVTMYRGQVLELKRLFQLRFGYDITGKIHFSTVDGFQGQEKDIIILSCVRAGPGLQNIGFLSDLRRMNVAMTRAKSSLFILGHAATLERSDETWREIVGNARARSLLLEADVNFFTAPSLPPGTLPRVIKPKANIKPSLHPPLDLATPRDLMSSVNKNPIVTNHAKPIMAPQDVASQSSMAAGTVSLAEGASMGQKRPADHEAAERPQVSTSNESLPKPVPPPAKRQKKDKGSIFIPKKPNRRP